MKQLPKPITILFLLLGAALIGLVLYEFVTKDNTSSGQQFLDQIEVQTDDPQPAGKNITR